MSGLAWWWRRHMARRHLFWASYDYRRRPTRRNAERRDDRARVLDRIEAGRP